MKREVLILGIALVALGVVGAAVASLALGDAASRWITECVSFNPPPDCSRFFGTMSTWGILLPFFEVLAGLGVVLLIVAVLLHIVERPAPTAAMGWTPPPGGPACARCGRATRWIPEYQRWYCDSCRWYV